MDNQSGVGGGMPADPNAGQPTVDPNAVPVSDVPAAEPQPTPEAPVETPQPVSEPGIPFGGNQGGQQNPAGGAPMM